MAAGYLPRPGTPTGPCVECAHVDCARTRTTAATVCALCFDPIGWDTAFYLDDEHGPVHETCLFDRIDASS